MVKHQDSPSFELFQTLNCTVRLPELQIITQTPPLTPLSIESPCRSSKEIEKDVDCIASLDKDKMMAHILDCLSALKRVEELHQEEVPDKRQLAAVKGRVFRKAIDLIMQPTASAKPDLARILQSFPDVTKLQDDRKWLSLHWAVLEEAKIDQEDIEVLYSSDPMALTRHHLKQVTDTHFQGYTPAHLISLQKNPRMPLVRFLDIHSPRAFFFPSRCFVEKRSRYPVQLTAGYTESLDFLQFLLQIQPGAPKLGLGSSSTPLCELIKVRKKTLKKFPDGSNKINDKL